MAEVCPLHFGQKDPSDDLYKNSVKGKPYTESKLTLLLSLPKSQLFPPISMLSFPLHGLG